MADQSNSHSHLATGGDDGPPSNLEGFIKGCIEEQQKQSKKDDNLDTEKRDNFVSRAISESRRMNREIQKSKEKSSRLHEEFGESRMKEWRTEHSSQVLSSEQAGLVEESYKSS